MSAGCGSGLGLKLVTNYQPRWGADGGGMERCKRDIERKKAMGGRERLVIEGILRTVWEGERKKEVYVEGTI